MKKVWYLLAVMVLGLSPVLLGGCESFNLEKMESVWGAGSTQALVGGAAAAAAPVTGGASLLGVQVLGMVLSAVFGINRAFAAHKRKRINERIVKGIQKAKNAKGLVDFKDPVNRAVLQAVMGPVAVREVQRIKLAGV